MCKCPAVSRANKLAFVTEHLPLVLRRDCLLNGDTFPEDSIQTLVAHLTKAPDSALEVLFQACKTNLAEIDRDLRAAKNVPNSYN